MKEKAFDFMYSSLLAVLAVAYYFYLSQKVREVEVIRTMLKLRKCQSDNQDLKNNIHHSTRSC
jgi:uncharacterized protein YybS (DUF2232 family)